MEKFLKQFIRQCNENFLEENPLDEVDISVVDNYTDYIIEKLEIFFDKMRRAKDESDKHSETRI